MSCDINFNTRGRDKNFLKPNTKRGNFVQYKLDVVSKFLFKPGGERKILTRTQLDFQKKPGKGVDSERIEGSCVRDATSPNDR